MKKKKALTLIEVMIALVLTSILLTTLFNFYKRLFITRSDIQKCKETILQRVWTQQRLAQIFDKTLPEVEQEKGLIFFSTDHSNALGPVLYFFYDNGIDPDPSFCGPLKAMLYLSIDKKLTLSTFSGREEILCERINSLRFSFFDEKEAVWKQQWSEKEQLPLMVKMILDENPFVFFLPSANKMISYKKPAQHNQ